MKQVTIERHRHLCDEPRTGHNRWHPDIPPILEVKAGEEVALQTRDAGDGYLTPKSTVADFPGFTLGAVHPLTGPVFVAGARPGDLENGGNLDVKQLTKGARLLPPVAVEGALFSTGDAHFAQGDGEVCLTAVEMPATCVVRFRVHAGEAERRGIRWPRLERSDYFADPRWAAPQRFVATVGMPVDADGVNRGEDLTLACRNAVLQMIDLLQAPGFSREQAYVIASVAVDLRINNVVDVPNYVVSALLPEDIFRG